jgi:hypothetical protein
VGAADAREAYDTIETRLAPRLAAFLRTDHYAELSAILATVAASPPGAGAHDMSGCNAANSALRDLRITPVIPRTRPVRKCDDDAHLALE